MYSRKLLTFLFNLLSLVGVSRSASVVIAYVMARKKIALKEALQLVRQSRQHVKPNMGFHKQLQVFEAMNFAIDKDSLVYRTYKLENTAELVSRG